MENNNKFNDEDDQKYTDEIPDNIKSSDKQANYNENESCEGDGKFFRI